MGIQQSGTPTNAILTRYEKKYRDGADYVRTYDQFAGVHEETFEPKGTTVQVFAKNKLQPRPTADIGSQTSDFEPQTWTDVVQTLTADYYADGVKIHQKAQLTNFSDAYANTSYLVGQNMMEVQDALARRSATQGTIVFYGGAATSRSGLTLSTATHHLRDVDIQKVKQFVAFWTINRFQGDTVAGIIDDWQYADLLTQSGSQVLQAGAYTEKGLGEFVLRWELGMLAGIRLVVSPYAKICYGAGAAAQTAISSVTLGAAALAGDRTVNLSGTITNLAV